MKSKLLTERNQEFGRGAKSGIPGALVMSDGSKAEQTQS